MKHYIQTLRQVVDLIIDAQGKSIDPSLGAAVGHLNRVIAKMRCPTCCGLGYLTEKNSLDCGPYSRQWLEQIPCPKCQKRAIEDGGQELPL
jgi:hypothetical protein